MLPKSQNQAIRIITTPLGDIELFYDALQMRLIVKFPPDLKIGFLNSINIEGLGEFNLDCKGEINFLSRRDINIDSLGARIFLNSLRCKQIRKIKKYRKLRRDQIKARKSKPVERNLFEEYIDALSNLNERVTKLEGGISSKTPSILVNSCNCHHSH